MDRRRDIAMNRYDTISAPAHNGNTGDRLFLAGQVGLLGSYVLLIAALLAALTMFTSPSHVVAAIASQEIRHALRLSLLSCALTSVLCLWIAIPAGYVLSR
jgi:molybdate transport system permease protein